MPPTRHRTRIRIITDPIAHEVYRRRRRRRRWRRIVQYAIVGIVAVVFAWFVLNQVNRPLNMLGN